MQKLWLYGMGLILSMALTSTGWGFITCDDGNPGNGGPTDHAICGDSVNAFTATGDPECNYFPANTNQDIPCYCGDFVLSDTKLNGGDPVTFTTCAGEGLVIGADDITLNCDNLSLTGDGSGNGNGVRFITFGSGVTVKNCFISGFANGIEADLCSGLTFKSNKVLFNNENGINLFYAVNSLLKANFVHDNGDDGISLDSNSYGNTVDGNKANSNGGAGIDVEGTSNGNSITHNTAERNEEAGIDLEENATGNSVAQNLVRRNNSDGIRVEESADGNFITSNEVSDNLEDGIDIETSNNTVFGNTGDHNGSDPDFDNGLEVDDGTGNALTNNVFNYDTRHGVCAIPGNTDGGGNKGKGNGVPPDVSFNDAACGESPI
jgi:parallel beta-helix repeat protein